MAGVLRVLVQHPATTIRRRIGQTLRAAGHDVVDCARPGRRALELLCAHRPDVAVVRDRGLAAEIVRDLDLRRPTVVLLSPVDLQTVAGALDLGVHDVLPDPPADGELLARVQAAARVTTLREHLLQREQRLEELAYNDELTGLWNRRYLQRRLAAELRAAERHGRPLAIAMIDVDHFKAINDRHGHLVGDEVLRAIADRLLGAMRDEDVLGRWGGEELLVILPAEPPGGVVRAAERLRQCVAERPLCGHAISATVSIGCAESEGDTSIDALVHRADEALYAAKRAGRDRVAIARLDGVVAVADGDRVERVEAHLGPPVR
jgi:two-component system cell cycle response regulator